MNHWPGTDMNRTGTLLFFWPRNRPCCCANLSAFSQDTCCFDSMSALFAARAITMFGFAEVDMTSEA